MIRARLFLLTCLLAGSACATERAPADAPFYRDAERGWFWRESPPERALPRPVTPKPIIGTTVGPQSNPSIAKPAPLSAEWLRENLESYRDAALDTPTPENVERYMLLQRYAMDKADRFSQVWMEVVADTPYLDESIDRPLSHGGKAVLQQQVALHRTQLLQRLAGQGIGIWYFYRSDCPYCARQEPALAVINRLHRLAVLPISLDGQAPASSTFERYALNQGQAEMLGVTGTPTLFLNSTRDGKVERLAVGLRAADEIEDALLYAAKRAGWITDDEFIEATAGSKLRMLVDAGNAPDSAGDDPDQMLAFLRAAAAPDLFTPIPQTPPSASTSRGALP